MSEEKIKELESQLSQHKAHVNRLKSVLDMFVVHCANDWRGKETEEQKLLLSFGRGALSNNLKEQG